MTEAEWLACADPAPTPASCAATPATLAEHFRQEQWHPKGCWDTPMTEAEWLACADPAPMLAFLRGNASDPGRALRQEQWPPKGCWVVDLILSKDR